MIILKKMIGDNDGIVEMGRFLSRRKALQYIEAHEMTMNYICSTLSENTDVCLAGDTPNYYFIIDTDIS